jgi:LmbE family N-acetylglucosaminyl deacetylase
MHTKVLLIVPHQDDELFVGGGLLKTFAESKEYEVYVVFTTNGDLYPGEGEVRLRESLHVLTSLYRIPEENIFFLGYGDSWQGEKHIYNMPGSKPMVSSCGGHETYGLPEHPEYRHVKSGRYSIYCRDNFKADLKGLMSDLMADVILAVDYDKHPDHKAASLMTEECIGEILKENTEYHPLVLKRYAYDGVWKGKADFFDLPRKRTILAGEEMSPYSEEDKICIAMPLSCSKPYLPHNFLYRAARCYQTQEVWQIADAFINIDEVYWRRNTDNLLYDAELQGSSGEVEFIRDFKLFDCGDVLQKELILKECAWLPAEADGERRIHIRFRQPQTIEQINLYAIGNPDWDAMQGEFVFDNGTRLSTGPLALRGKKNRLTIERQSGISDIDFYLTECSGNPVGITEMEILSAGDGDVPALLQDLVFQEDSLPYSAHNKMIIHFQKAALSLHRKLYRFFPNVFFLKRHYPELNEGRKTVFPYRLRYAWERVRDKCRAI